MATTGTTIIDLPEEMLSKIITAVAHVWTRNSAALVCRKWYIVERGTRTNITLRGNLGELFKVATSFPSISDLDLSLLSPWGHPISSASNPELIAHLQHAFPSLSSITFYARNLSTISLVSKWQNVKHFKLIRWHQRPGIITGDVLKILFSQCQLLESVDLSLVRCSSEGVTLAFELYPTVASNLTHLNLSIFDDLKSGEIMIITKLCPNLTEFKAVCSFDPSYVGFVGDGALASILANCPKLRILHLADSWVLFYERVEPEYNVYEEQDAEINKATLIELFSGLPLLEELVLDLDNNIRDSGAALEVLNSKCPKLRSLKLRHFQGISTPDESKLDGVALCHGLKSLVIWNVGDLSDIGLIGIGRGCCRLTKLGIHGCPEITAGGLGTLAWSLRTTLVDVSISCCRNLNAMQCLKALEPIHDRIERLHIDCIWDSVKNLDGEEGEGEGAGFDLNASKRCKYSYDLNIGFVDDNNNNRHNVKTWDKLQYLSLWIRVGQLLTPLMSKGLHNCPNLEEILIKVEGNCRGLSKPSAEGEFGLNILMNYPKLWKMHLHCGDTMGYGHPMRLWERFYLSGIRRLRLRELDYWPPHDDILRIRGVFPFRQQDCCRNVLGSGNSSSMGLRTSI